MDKLKLCVAIDKKQVVISTIDSNSSNVEIVDQVEEMKTISNLIITKSYDALHSKYGLKVTPNDSCTVSIVHCSVSPALVQSIVNMFKAAVAYVENPTVMYVQDYSSTHCALVVTKNNEVVVHYRTVDGGMDFTVVNTMGECQEVLDYISDNKDLIEIANPFVDFG